MEDRVNVELKVTQVKDGEEYKGNLTIDKVAFDYSLKFGVHIDKLDDIPQEKMTREYGRELFQFDVKDAKGESVTLDNEMFGFFLATAGRYAMEFYNDPQTRDSNAGFLGDLMHGEGPFSELGCGLEIAMQSRLQIGSTPGLVEFLKPYTTNQDDGAYIVVAQTNSGPLEDIREKISPDCNNKLVYFREPSEVLKEVQENPVDVLITGQCFYYTNLDSLGDIFAAMSAGNIQDFVQPKSIDSGSELSQLVHRIRPEVIVFRYSVTPDEDPVRSGFAGDIPKFGSSDAIFDLVNSNDLSDIIKTKDWKKLRESFPDIRFHETLERQHGGKEE